MEYTSGGRRGVRKVSYLFSHSHLTMTEAAPGGINFQAALNTC